MPQAASAGSFEVAPTTINLPSEASSTVIHLTNRGNEVVFAQTEAFNWQQPAMKDQLTPSTSLLISPPIVRLAPGQQQTIRVVTMTANNAKQENAYRLVISELPDPALKHEGIKVLLQFLVPVFIAGTETPSPSLQWKAVEESDGVALTAYNAGPAHLKLTDITVKNTDGHELATSGLAFSYILPGAAHQWKIVAAAHVVAGQSLSIQAKDEKSGILKGSYVVEK